LAHGGTGMPAHKGTRLGANERYSDVFPGYIEKGGGLFRKPFFYEGSGKQANHYYMLKSCAACGKEMLQNKSNAARSSVAFCSPKCLLQVREKPDGIVRRKRGKGIGHVLEKACSHPAARKGFVPQHRLRVEEQIGRHLLLSEVVHHINCVEDDNRIENLHVCSSISEHNMAHASLLKCVKPLMELGILFFDRSQNKYIVSSSALIAQWGIAESSR
jgi:hypothetical protein